MALQAILVSDGFVVNGLLQIMWFMTLDADRRLSRFLFPESSADHGLMGFFNQAMALHTGLSYIGFTDPGFLIFMFQNIV